MRLSAGSRRHRRRRPHSGGEPVGRRGHQRLHDSPSGPGAALWRRGQFGHGQISGQVGLRGVHQRAWRPLSRRKHRPRRALSSLLKGCVKRASVLAVYATSWSRSNSWELDVAKQYHARMVGSRDGGDDQRQRRRARRVDGRPRVVLGVKALFGLSDAMLSLLFAAGAGAIAAMPVAGLLPSRMGGTGMTLRISGPIFAVAARNRAGSSNRVRRPVRSPPAKALKRRDSCGRPPSAPP